MNRPLKERSVGRFAFDYAVGSILAIYIAVFIASFGSLVSG